ncbi:MAG: metal-dependent transcriptional regulator [Thermodesulfobacteriota bacterium]
MSEDLAVIEETLEFIWAQRELGFSSIPKLLEIEEIRQANVDKEVLVKMQKQGLLFIRGDHVALTDRGDVLAAQVVRRHRLAERLLTEVLDVTGDNMEREACTFEHILSKGITDSICTLLGHPPACPHGHPIPRGECCEKSHSELRPIVRPLVDLPAGAMGKIVFILPSAHSRLDRLSSIGLFPGSVIRVHQKSPAFVLELGETTVAIDKDIAKEIFVRVVK